MTDLPSFHGDLSWAVRGDCRDHQHPEWWFPETGETAGYGMAKQVCQQCPVIDQCRAHGIEHETVGMWGGLTPSERERARHGLPAETRGRGRPPGSQLTDTQQAQIVELRATTEVADIAATFDVSTETVYRVLRRHKQQTSKGNNQ